MGSDHQLFLAHPEQPPPEQLQAGCPSPAIRPVRALRCEPAACRRHPALASRWRGACGPTPGAGISGQGGMGWADAVGGKGRCRVGRAVSHPGPSPAPDKEISTIRLFRRWDSWLPTPDPDRDPWAWKRPLSEEIREPLPRETLALAATAQPLVPGPLRRFDESQQTLKVAIHAEVVEVTSQTSTERGVLCLNRLMPMASTPIVDGLLGPSQARPPSLAPHPPVTFTGTSPIEREP
jgi:hypothetical protein